MKTFRSVLDISHHLKWIIFMFYVTIYLGTRDFQYFWVMTLPETQKGGKWVITDVFFSFYFFLNLWILLFLSGVLGTTEGERIWMLIKYVNIRFDIRHRDPLPCLVFFIMINIYWTLNQSPITTVQSAVSLCFKSLKCWTMMKLKI